MVKANKAFSRYDNRAPGGHVRDLRSSKEEDGHNKGSNRTLKNKIRSLERLIKKSHGNMEMKKELEDKLFKLKAANEFKSSKREQVEKEKKIAKRNHKPKFVERVKLTRKIRQVIKDQSSNADEKQAKLVKDLKYALYFPKGNVYLSILNDSRLSPDDIAKREKLRNEAEKLADEDGFDLKKFLGVESSTDNLSEGKLPDEKDDFFL